MQKHSLDTLAALKLVFEKQEDWVSVGHVAYLIERLSGSDKNISPPAWDVSPVVTLH